MLLVYNFVTIAFTINTSSDGSTYKLPYHAVPSDKKKNKVKNKRNMKWKKHRLDSDTHNTFTLNVYSKAADCCYDQSVNSISA